MASGSDFKYYQSMRLKYNQMINPSPKKLPEKPADYYIKAESKEARDLLFSVFKKAKRGMGYGG